MYLVAILVRVSPGGALALLPDIAQQELNLHRDGHPIKIRVFPLKAGPGGKIRIVDLEEVPAQRVSSSFSLIINLLPVELIIGCKILKGDPVRITSKSV